jgi:hypothetical protein
MAFWDAQGILVLEIFDCGSTQNADCYGYGTTPQDLKKAI